MLFTGAGGAPTTIQLYEGIVAAGGDPFDFAHPGTVDTFRFLAALRPYLLIGVASCQVEHNQ